MLTGLAKTFNETLSSFYFGSVYMYTRFVFMLYNQINLR